MTHSRPLSQDLASRVILAAFQELGVLHLQLVISQTQLMETRGHQRLLARPLVCEVSKGGMGWPSKGVGLIDDDVDWWKVEMVKKGLNGELLVDHGGFGAVPRFGTHLANRSMKLPMPPQLFEEAKINLHIFSHLLPSSPIFQHQMLFVLYQDHA